MTRTPFFLTTCAGLFLAGCMGSVPADKTRDRGIDSHSLTTLQWGVYVDPDGCDHWIADDGLEGYQVNRLDKYGRPVCSGVAPPTQTAGDFKGGSRLPDPN